MSTVVEWLALGVSVGSAAVAWLAYRRSSKTEARLLVIEESRERDRILEARKAVLVARITREPSNRPIALYLEVENKGLAPAHDICITLDGGTLFGHPAVVKTGEEVTHVWPQSAFRYRLAPHSSAPLPRGISLTWSDDSGEPGKYETTLT